MTQVQKIIKFVKKRAYYDVYGRWLSDDFEEYWTTDRKVEREAFIECLKKGAVRKNDYIGVWEWSPQKAKPILEKYGYTVIIEEEKEEPFIKLNVIRLN